MKQPIFVDEKWNLTALAALSHATSSTTASGFDLVDSSTDKSVLGAMVSYAGDSDQFRMQPQIVYAGAYDHLGESGRDIVLGTGTLSYAHRFDADYSATAFGSWQYTDSRTIPGDLLFQIGGPNSVRGYPNGAVAGDSGYFGQLELHRRWPGLLHGMDAYVFADVGQVFAREPNHQTLYSAGIGTSVSLTKWGRLDINVGFPLKDAVPEQDSVAVTARLTLQIF